MPHFYHRKEKYYLTTNYKVMFSTLNHQANMYRPKARALLCHRLYQGMFPGKAKKHYLLVRDPYTRIESFYRDKFRVTENIDQKCIKLFYRFIGIDKRDSKVEKIRALRKIKFNTYVSFLPYIYQLDGHLTPQYKVLNTDMHGLLFKLKIDDVIKIDKHRNDKRLKQDLEIDLGRITNVTGHYNIETSWTKKSIKIINELYNMDFMFYDYEKRMP